MREGGPGAECDLAHMTSGPALECKQPHCAGNYRKINTDRSVKMWIKLEFISHTITIIITTRQVPPSLTLRKTSF